jgi:hypothetical protein
MSYRPGSVFSSWQSRPLTPRQWFFLHICVQLLE